MQNLKIIVFLVLLLSLGFFGFQCSSTEITSAKLYIQQKNYDKAIEVLQKEVSQNPKSDEGYYLLGYAYGEKENISEMIKSYDNSVAISNKFVTNIEDSKKYFWATLFNKGVSQYQRGINTSDADSSKLLLEKSSYNFEQAIILQPDSADTYKNLAFVYMSSGRDEDAIAPFEKLIELEKSEDGYKYIGELLYTEGNQYMNDYSTNGNIQDSVKAMNYYNKAITILEEGRAVHPDNADILIFLSNSYIAANKIDVAINTFEAGVKQDPQNKYFRYNYGVLLLGANRFSEAEEQFKGALDIDPEYQNAVYNIAVTYVKWGTEINKVNEETGVMSDDYKEKYRSALPYLEKVVQMESQDAGIWELLGRVYSVLGMADDASNAFQKADEIRKG